MKSKLSTIPSGVSKGPLISEMQMVGGAHWPYSTKKTDKSLSPTMPSQSKSAGQAGAQATTSLQVVPLGWGVPHLLRHSLTSMTSQMPSTQQATLAGPSSHMEMLQSARPGKGVPPCAVHSGIEMTRHESPRQQARSRSPGSTASHVSRILLRFKSICGTPSTVESAIWQGSN